MSEPLTDTELETIQERWGTSSVELVPRMLAEIRQGRLREAQHLRTMADLETALDNRAAIIRSVRDTLEDTVEFLDTEE